MPGDLEYHGFNALMLHVGEVHIGAHSSFTVVVCIRNCFRREKIIMEARDLEDWIKGLLHRGLSSGP